MDAYEFSFVAVPAQREAGVIKGMGRKGRTLKDLAEEFGAQAEYRQLFKQAQLGRQYEKDLQDAVVRLCLSLELGAEEPVLRNIVNTAAAEDLLKLRTSLQKRLEEMLPVTTQLHGYSRREESVESGFLI
jgi:hypothetical protein